MGIGKHHLSCKLEEPEGTTVLTWITGGPAAFDNLRIDLDFSIFCTLKF